MAPVHHKPTDYAGPTYELFIGLYGNPCDAARKHGNGGHLAQWRPATSCPEWTRAGLVARGAVLRSGERGAGGLAAPRPAVQSAGL